MNATRRKPLRRASTPLLFALLLFGGMPLAAQERAVPLARSVSLEADSILGELLQKGRFSMPPDLGPDALADSLVTAVARKDAMINGALVAVGALGVFDNVVVHWILGWHRAIEDSPYALQIEIGIVVLSTAMLVTGIWRERQARRR
jgi:hypothetical protein